MSSIDWKLSSYHFKLPESLIAQYPTRFRDQSRMLFLDRSKGTVSHRKFSEIITLLPKNSCLVINNTRVNPVRLTGDEKQEPLLKPCLLKKKIWRIGVLFT